MSVINLRKTERKMVFLGWNDVSTISHLSKLEAEIIVLEIFCVFLKYVIYSWVILPSSVLYRIWVMVVLHFLSSEELTFEKVKHMQVLDRFVWSATFPKKTLKNYVTKTFFHEGFSLLPLCLKVKNVDKPVFLSS